MQGLSIWTRIALWRSGNESIAGWRQRFGAEFDALRPYLRKCPGLRVKGYPCPDTGLRLTVRERKCGGYTAFATDEDAGYIDDVFLDWDDVQAWRLDEGALVSAVAAALGIEGSAGVGVCETGALLDVGVCRRTGGKRMLMCMAGDGESAIPAVCGLGEGDGVGCVLVPDRFAGV